MAGRKKFNRKRKLAPEGSFPAEELEQLAQAADCSGNPLHKLSRGDFDLTPPAQARKPSKEQQSRSVRDTAKLFKRKDAIRYLREGPRRGMISVVRINGWPKQVWAVADDGIAMEAQRDGNGSYHGFAMPKDDPMEDIAKRGWEAG